jgi:hypothetical protein
MIRLLYVLMVAVGAVLACVGCERVGCGCSDGGRLRLMRGLAQLWAKGFYVSILK